MFEHLVPLVMLFWKVVEPLESRVWMEEVGHEGVSLGFLKSTYLCRTAKMGLRPLCATGTSALPCGGELSEFSLFCTVLLGPLKG